MSKHVLVLSPPFRPNVGGVETHLNDLVKDGVGLGINFTVVTYQPLVTKARGKYIEYGKGYKIIRVPWPRFNLFLALERLPALEFLYLFPGLFVVSFFYLLFSSDIKVIHAQGLVAGTVSVVLAKLFNLKVILSTHSIYNFPDEGMYSSFVRAIFNACDHVLCLSHKSKEEVLKLGVNKSKVTTFKYWVDQKVFRPKNKSFARSKLGLPARGFQCLFVGRLVEVKGVKELVSAARKSKSLSFVIVGDGPLSGFVQERAQTSHNIIFPGRVENSDLPDYYNACDILIVPSTHEEGFGRVILEALSCGLPVVGADRGAIPEAINKEVGILIDVSPKEISSTLSKLSRDRSRLRRMSRKARVFSSENYDKSNINMITMHY